jgi:hypothetical protein
MYWAGKYFKAWLETKDKQDLDITANVKVRMRGWKQGTMTQFFDLKDNIFRQKYPDYENPELGE